MESTEVALVVDRETFQEIRLGITELLNVEKSLHSEIQHVRAYYEFEKKNTYFP